MGYPLRPWVDAATDTAAGYGVDEPLNRSEKKFWICSEEPGATQGTGYGPHSAAAGAANGS
ncbi:hypothetical protein [Nocardia rhizosphaerihabitans]|uniref:hypothetical protein n=1 Tax=Nocardia rhizosphaerihabitans TaxID=1691570 RepID=UPI00166EE218|nr:hypothetical protein [Nocardia rhizosphaerihabitans]